MEKGAAAAAPPVCQKTRRTDSTGRKGAWGCARRRVSERNRRLRRLLEPVFTTAGRRMRGLFPAIPRQFSLKSVRIPAKNFLVRREKSSPIRHPPVMNTGFNFHSSRLSPKREGADFPGNQNGAENASSAPPEAGNYFLATASALYTSKMRPNRGFSGFRPE